ncbi:MAG: hypothetical protein KJN84_17710, partial [Bacteroidia bacterium]|nr:hypothetical protein [Bacteroidia bacterium]
FTLIVLTALSTTILSQNKTLSRPNVEQENMVGEWILDLRPTPQDAPYLQSLIIESQDGDQLKGSFYGSPIKEAFINEKWEKQYFAFKSSDYNNTYYQSGYIIGDKIYGVSYCPNRNFVMPWSGTKKAKMASK